MTLRRLISQQVAIAKANIESFSIVHVRCKAAPVVPAIQSDLVGIVEGKITSNVEEERPGFFARVIACWKGVPLKGATHPPEPALFKDGGKRFYSPEPLKSIPKDFKEHPERNPNKLSDDISYDEFDVLISDINEEELVKIGKMRGIENLSSGSFASPAFPVNGKVHGLNIRYMIPLVCQRAGIPNSRAIQIWFLVDTSSPYTCLTSKSLEAIFDRNVTNDLYELAIQDQTSKIECQVSKAHFEEVNILGADAMLLLGLSIQVDWKNREFKLFKS